MTHGQPPTVRGLKELRRQQRQLPPLPVRVSVKTAASQVAEHSKAGLTDAHVEMLGGTQLVRDGTVLLRPHQGLVVESHRRRWLGEELEQAIKELPRDKEVVELYKKMAGGDPLPLLAAATHATTGADVAVEPEHLGGLAVRARCTRVEAFAQLGRLNENGYPTTFAIVWEGSPADQSAALYGWSVTSDHAWTYLYAHCYRQFGYDDVLGVPSHDRSCSARVTVARVPVGELLHHFPRRYVDTAELSEVCSDCSAQIAQRH